MALRRGEAEQSPRLLQVLRPALAFILHRAEAALRVCMALRRSEAVQPPRLRKVLRPAVASNMHHSEDGLRVSITPSSRLEKFTSALRHALVGHGARVVITAMIDLRAQFVTCTFYLHPAVTS